MRIFAKAICVNRPGRRAGHRCALKKRRLGSMTFGACGCTHVIIPGAVTFRRPPTRSLEPSLREDGDVVRSGILGEQVTTGKNQWDEKHRPAENRRKPPAKIPALRHAHEFIVRLSFGRLNPYIPVLESTDCTPRFPCFWGLQASAFCHRMIAHRKIEKLVGNGATALTAKLSVGGRVRVIQGSGLLELVQTSGSLKFMRRSAYT
jgi:hypothetical protein